MRPLRLLRLWLRTVRRPSPQRLAIRRSSWHGRWLRDRLDGFRDERTKNIAGMRRGTRLWRRS